MVCYIEIVQVSYVSHILHPTKTTTVVKPLPPPVAWVWWICLVQRKDNQSEVLAERAVEGFVLYDK
jgi:hypothetical protein